MLKILFVCLGNVCRSPLAHGILEDYIVNLGYTGQFMVDSAGTTAFHVDCDPDLRSIKVAKSHNINLQHKARQFVADDFFIFDYILVMDHLNYEDVLNLDESMEHKAKVFMLRSFDPLAYGEFNVPDPYYGVESDFEEVFAICERSIHGFIDFLKTQHLL